MLRCKLIHILWAVLPVNGLKDRLMRAHMSRCSSCRGALATREDIRRILVQEEDISGFEGLWPGIQGSISKPQTIPSSSGRGHGLILGFSAAGALAGFFAVALLFNVFLTRFSPSNTGGGFEIHHIRVDNRPARTFIVKPPESGMILVWAEKSPQEETGHDM